MSETKLEDIRETLRMIDANPPEHLSHVIARGIREHDQLKEVVVIGKDPTLPITASLFAVIGNHATEGPVYAFRPAPESAEQLAIVDAIMQALKRGPLEQGGEEEIRALTASGIHTAVFAYFGEDAAGKAVCVLMHHPSIRFAQAAGMLLGTLYMHSERQRTGAS